MGVVINKQADFAVRIARNAMKMEAKDRQQLMSQLGIKATQLVNVAIRVMNEKK